jgi:hypothetical protein
VHWSSSQRSLQFNKELVDAIGQYCYGERSIEGLYLGRWLLLGVRRHREERMSLGARGRTTGPTQTQVCATHATKSKPKSKSKSLYKGSLGCRSFFSRLPSGSCGSHCHWYLAQKNLLTQNTSASFIQYVHDSLRLSHERTSSVFN